MPRTHSVRTEGSRFPALLLVLALVAAPSLGAQVDADSAPQAPGFAPAETVDRFLDGAGPGWRVSWDLGRGVPASIHGGSRGVDLSLGHERAARDVIDELSGALGFGAADLVLDRVKPLNLSRIGSSDKVVVRFEQVVDGVPTHQGGVHVLFSADGQVLSVTSNALPHVRQTTLWPTLGLDGALEVARAAFAADTGRAPLSAELDRYVVFPAPITDRGSPGLRPVRAAPAWLIVVSAPADAGRAGTPFVREYAVAARGEPRVLDSWDLVHHLFDLTGTVQGWGQPGLLPDGADPAVLLPLEGVRLSAFGQPDVLTDASGHFSFPGVNTTLTVTADFDTPFAQVENADGSEVSISQSVSPGAPATFTFNTGLTQAETAQVNTLRGIMRFREWLLSVDPTETIFDFPVLAFTMVDDTCNAVFQGTQMSFYDQGGDCPNTAYSTVIYHEQGHWANSLFGGGNSSTGIGEGGADIWSMYISDQPVVGDEFHGPGTYIRSGLNTNMYCGDGGLGCYGGSHANGQPFMGAAWKLRQRLKDDFGAVTGGDIADLIFLSWHQAFDDTLLLSVIEEHWLVLDDDNGNLDDGTPHYAQIDGGFRDQGWPGVDIGLFDMTHDVDDLVSHEGPVTVDIDVVETLGTLDTVVLHWSSDDGQSWNDVVMAPVVDDTWRAQIPGQASPETVRYHFTAHAVGGSSNRLPRRAPDDHFRYDVGVRTTVAFYDFEGVDDEGWTHQLFLEQDDWQRGDPAGKAGDPSEPWSGGNVWGNDLGNLIGTANWNGAYKPDVDNALFSPTFDLSGSTNTRLRFRRWLTVEKSEFDFARIAVDGVTAWENPFDVTIIDKSWVPFDLDVSALADGDASVQFRFGLTTAGGLEIGGWNIDDFEIVSLGEITDSTFVEYGTGTPGTGGLTPHLSGSGQSVPGGPITIAVTDARPSSLGAFFVGTSPASIPALGGTILVQPLLLMVFVNTDGNGDVTLPATIPDDDALIGAPIALQYWVEDAAGAGGYAASNGLSFSIE